MNENTFVDSFFFRFSLLASPFFSSVTFLSSKPFQNNQIHCEIINHYFNVFFYCNTTKTQVWASKPVYWSPKRLGYVTVNLIYLCLCLRLGLCDLFFIIFFTFIIINRIISLKQIHLFFQNKLYLSSFQLKSQSQGVGFVQHLLIFFQFQPGVAYKSVVFLKTRVVNSLKFYQSICSCLYSHKNRVC